MSLCRRHPEFRKPKHKGHPLDWCYSWAANCGKAAADADCDGFTAISCE